MLALAGAGDEADVFRIWKRIQLYYDANATTLDTFSETLSAEQRRAALKTADKSQYTTKPLLALLHRSAERLGDL